ncbi:hypothetical protein IFM89_021703 [Coptis chinensis]|uniref:Uncharacterized protein n=1 Tax=Coptis chinensis TaxID=261450 RepID=A0A835J1B9_9MAGN|nr:hypothetical protein IFM89_021703 [Coptis chinensis]
MMEVVKLLVLVILTHGLNGSLSREHIQTMVECGCPSLFQKLLIQLKKIESIFLKLDEGDAKFFMACPFCMLPLLLRKARKALAYGILKDSEASACTTVDIVSMLLIYALDPIVLSGEEKPHGREQIEASARKLLSELVELSETPPDPALPKPAINPQECKADGPNRVNIDDIDKKKGTGHAHKETSSVLSVVRDKPKDEVAEYEDIIWKRPR